MKLTNRQLSLLEKATQLIAVSGAEDEVRLFLKKEFESKGLPIVSDNLGSIYAYKKANHPKAFKVMLAGHMDEIGFMVLYIMDNGLIKAAPLGGHSKENLASQRVVLKAKDGRKYFGAITSIPPHLKKDKNGQVSEDKFIDDLLFDFGFVSKEDAEKAGVSIGNSIVILGDFKVLNVGQRLLAKAFDNRYGIALLLDLLDELANEQLPFDLYLGANVQEEVGLRGAQTSAQAIKPDLAIVLDCSPARDIGDDKNEYGKLGEGVLIRYLDRSMIAFPELLDLQIKACQNTGVKYQYFDSPGGTDAGAIHKANSGALTLTHCICARGIHSPSSMIDVDDYLAAKKSLLYILRNLDNKTLLALKKARQ
ncbi:MAG: M20/M25/M40 family metallo-hydrolase [Bacilli bacterium]|nr:M20/M25/M40 family metallo-hydrolase [Bacilli bacterium]